MFCLCCVRLIQPHSHAAPRAEPLARRALPFAHRRRRTPSCSLVLAGEVQERWGRQAGRVVRAEESAPRSSPNREGRGRAARRRARRSRRCGGRWDARRREDPAPGGFLTPSQPTGTSLSAQTCGRALQHGKRARDRETGDRDDERRDTSFGGGAYQRPVAHRQAPARPLRLGPEELAARPIDQMHDAPTSQGWGPWPYMTRIPSSASARGASGRSRGAPDAS